MGTFRIEIQAVGGHGCQRDVKERELVQAWCNANGCPDCLAREFVKKLAKQGNNVESAKLIHWPESEGQVVDDLSTLRRGPGAFTR